MQTRPLTVLSAVLIWLLSTIFAIPDAIGANIEEYVIDMNKTIAVCTPFADVPYKLTYAKYNLFAKALIYYILPLIIISCFYVLMARRLHESANQMPGELQGQSVAQARARRHVARMVLAFVFRKYKYILYL